MECMKETFVKGQLLDGRFRTVAPLNHGSFGMVFLAQEISTGREVAIKCSTKQPSADAATLESIDDEELYCHQTLRHDHLVNLVHHFETGPHTYLVLEYCSQGDLYEAIRYGRGPLETEHVRDFMLQLVGAVEHMHAKGLYHRDIKPENIFLTYEGCMKLGDFGLATRAPWSYEPCVGSDRYMAPEQYDPAGTGYSPAKADIWSIGICLLNILFSRNPFTTPTESDLLFADLRRDRQSLFDVFPNMSQDTFEVLSHALTIDPEKRSLTAVRDALLRTISFTTDDEILDDFCTEERDLVQASANREPLRTPSLQSPVLTQNASFPWAKVLNIKSPQKVHHLPMIPDTETYDDNLFPGSHRDLASSWFTGRPNTPSTASALDSGLGASFESMAIRRPEKRFSSGAGPVPITGSLPVPTMAKPIPSMSTIFGKKDSGVSKSWSDIWDEEVEQFEQDDMETETFGEQIARSFSHDSRDDDVTVCLDERPTHHPSVLREQQSASNIPRRADFAHDATADSTSNPDENGFVIVESTHPVKRSFDKRDGTDKWAELGYKRRNGLNTKDFAPVVSNQTATMTKWRKDLGLGSSVHRGGVSHRWGNRLPYHSQSTWLHQDWRRDQHASFRSKQVYDSGEDDLEWVGGWHAFHL